MSRVYDALRQWNRERGLSADIFKYEGAAQEPTKPEESETQELLRWDSIAEFVAACRPEDHLIALNNGKELGNEKFRLLQSRLRQMSLLRKINTVLITSAVPEDGKSLVAANLAISLATHTNLKVLLLEGDLHKPTLAKKVGLTGRPGLSECLSNGGTVEKSCYRLRNNHLWVLPAGRSQEHPLSLLQSAIFQRIFAILSSAFDWILIDSPPLLPLADAGFWAQQSDGILLVVRNAHTPRELLKRSLEVIDTSKLIGVVFNDSQPTEHDYYKRYYRSPNPAPEA
jgi:capsular exopolysaccharide synthesis family protein